ncbi:hypothetical protein ACHAW6_015647 [Cyclotella cf. meneghiniana]
MSANRKLQTEIDRVMKKVDEGVELFDEIWEKVYSAEQQNQKEKYEIELKKEIKKLQRLRDQIKTWIGGTEVKDKDSLLEARRLIETKMEQFKICEKETKTKAYSKEGLAKADRLDPEEQKKEETISWISEIIDQIQGLIDEQELEVEKLSAGKGKKTNKNQLDECQQHLANHKYHLNKLEGIMRLVRNDRISAETVDEVKEDLEYYCDSHQEDDYIMAYDQDTFYDMLGLGDLDVVNVDRVTQVPTSSKKKDDDATSASSGSDKNKIKRSSTASSGIIPLTIGRARVSKADKNKEKEDASVTSNNSTPSKVGRSSSTVSAGPAPTPTPKAPSVAPGGGASMAAVLKRESEERQKAALQAQQQALQQEQARQAELLRQQQLQKQQALQQEQARQAELLRQQQKAAQAEALKRQQAAQLEQTTMVQAKPATQTVLNAGIATLSLNSNLSSHAAAPAAIATTATSAVQLPQAGVVPTEAKDVTDRYLNALNDSFLQMPTGADSERQKSYTPRNPYPTPSCYPQNPSPIFENPAVFEKLGTDALFFIFYYAQGTYQQYLAARELKKQSWRYHKKYMTWFQRHEEPKVTTDDYEQGTYVYFDYETGWTQRIKADFRFEYSFLEDSLSV